MHSDAMRRRLTTAPEYVAARDSRPGSGALVYNPLLHTYDVPEELTARVATSSGRRPRTDTSRDDPGPSGSGGGGGGGGGGWDGEGARTRVRSAPPARVRSPTREGRRNPLSGEWIVPPRVKERPRNCGLRQVPLPDRIGKYDPITHSWLIPPRRPGPDRSGRAIVPLPDRIGRYNVMTHTYIVPPKLPPRGTGRGRDGLEALTRRTGVFDPVKAEWVRAPAGADADMALRRARGELRGEHAGTFEFSRRNRAHTDISWQEKPRPKPHRPPSAPDRWDPAAKVIPRGSVGGGTVPVVRAAPTGNCSPERRRGWSKTIEKTARQLHSGALPAWRPVETH